MAHSYVTERGLNTACMRLISSTTLRTSLVVQWLRGQAPSAGVLGLISGQKKTKQNEMKHSTWNQNFLQWHSRSWLSSLTWSSLTFGPEVCSGLSELPSVFALKPMMVPLSLSSEALPPVLGWLSPCNSDLTSKIISPERTSLNYWIQSIPLCSQMLYDLILLFSYDSIFFFKCLFYLTTPGLSCYMQDFLAVACEFLVAAGGIYFPDQGTHLGPCIESTGS